MGMVYCRGCGKDIHETAPLCPACGAPQFGYSVDSASSVAIQPHNADAILIQQIADYERISGYVWIVLGAIQVVSVVGLIAGIWNIFAGRSRLQIVPHILERDATIPESFENISGLIVIAILNAFLGGVIGLLFVGLDFFIRDKVLTSRHLFYGELGLTKKNQI